MIRPLVEAVGSFIFGCLIFYSIRWWAYLWRRSRRMRTPRPQKGTRPQVSLIHDGVQYDLTESLLRINDSADGYAVWVVLGPQHVRFRSGPVKLGVQTPVPLKTAVKLEIVSPEGETTGRFMTRDELVSAYPELATEQS